MERNFKKEIQEAASNPIDMADMMAQLVQVLHVSGSFILFLGLIKSIVTKIWNTFSEAYQKVTRAE